MYLCCPLGHLFSLMAGCFLHLFAKPCFIVPSSIAIRLFVMLSPTRPLLVPSSSLMFYVSISSGFAFSLAFLILLVVCAFLPLARSLPLFPICVHMLMPAHRWKCFVLSRSNWTTSLRFGDRFVFTCYYFDYKKIMLLRVNQVIADWSCLCK